MESHECELKGCENLTSNSRFCSWDCYVKYCHSNESYEERKYQRANESERVKARRAKAIKSGWTQKRERDDFPHITKEYRQRISIGVKAAYARGAYNDERNRKISRGIKMSWARGDHANDLTPEALEKRSEGLKRAHARGCWDHVYTEEHAQKISMGVRAAWERGDYDGIYKNPSSIELLVADYLDSINIEYIQQFRPEGTIKPFDFYFPRVNCLLEVQGDYWHNLPGARARDKIKADGAIALGYIVREIWEHEIHNNLEENLKWLQEYSTLGHLTAQQFLQE